MDKQDFDDALTRLHTSINDIKEAFNNGDETGTLSSIEELIGNAQDLQDALEESN